MEQGDVWVVRSDVVPSRRRAHAATDVAVSFSKQLRGHQHANLRLDREAPHSWNEARHGILSRNAVCADHARPNRRTGWLFGTDKPDSAALLVSKFLGCKSRTARLHTGLIRAGGAARATDGLSASHGPGGRCQEACAIGIVSRRVAPCGWSRIGMSSRQDRDRNATYHLASHRQSSRCFAGALSCALECSKAHACCGFGALAAAHRDDRDSSNS